MWHGDKDPCYPDEHQNIEKMLRTSSPPFEGGESLCEVYMDPLGDYEKSKSAQLNQMLPEHFDNASTSTFVQQNVAIFSPDGDRLPSRSYASFFSQDVPPSGTFTQAFLQSILSSVDSTDPVVANAWMETLLDVIDLLPKDIVKNEILTLAVNKGQMSQPVPSRLLSCRMIAKICVKFDSYVIKKEVLPVVLSLCQDVDFEVRGSICRQLHVIAREIGLEATKSAILQELVELANDEETYVRLAAVETVVHMLPMLDDDICIYTIIPLVKKLCENSLSSKDSTLPVIAHQIGRLCYGLKENFSPEQKLWFLTFFTQLAELGLPSRETNNSLCGPLPDLLPEVDHKDKFRECRFSCAYNFPAMVVFVGPEMFERELYGTFCNLCTDPYPGVRQKMACGFYEIASLLGKNAKLLMSELVQLLQDECLEVIKGLIPSLPKCLISVCSNSKNVDKGSLVGALKACEEITSVTSSWRLHADFLTSLSCLPSCVSHDLIFTDFVPLLFMKLHTARPLPCRTAAAYSLLIFLRKTPSLERRKGIINEIIRELCFGRSCHKRMLFVRVCELAMELFSKMFYKTHFFRPLFSLAGDPVPNIRLRLCSVLPRLKGLLQLPRDGQLLQLLEACVKTLMSEEKDRDVKQAIGKAIQELDKIEVAEESVTRRTSFTESALDREDHFKEQEERLQLEMEFKAKSFGTSTNVLRARKIPIFKNGTLPKPSKAKEAESLLESSKASTVKSLQLLKKQRRISTPVMSVDFHRHQPSEGAGKDKTTDTVLNAIRNGTLKCNLPKSSGANVRTWPRQKTTSRPQQPINRCPSPMPKLKFGSKSTETASAAETNPKTTQTNQTTSKLKDKSVDKKCTEQSAESIQINKTASNLKHASTDEKSTEQIPKNTLTNKNASNLKHASTDEKSTANSKFQAKTNEIKPRDAKTCYSPPTWKRRSLEIRRRTPTPTLLENEISKLKISHTTGDIKNLNLSVNAKNFCEKAWSQGSPKAYRCEKIEGNNKAWDCSNRYPFLSKDMKMKFDNRTVSSDIERKRRSIGAILPSPEIPRRSTPLVAESKIPTSRKCLARESPLPK